MTQQQIDQKIIEHRRFDPVSPDQYPNRVISRLLASYVLSQVNSWPTVPARWTALPVTRYQPISVTVDASVKPAGSRFFACCTCATHDSYSYLNPTLPIASLTASLTRCSNLSMQTRLAISNASSVGWCNCIAQISSKRKIASPSWV